MNTDIQRFIEALGLLTNPRTNDHLESDLYEITAPIRELKNIDSAIAPVFRFFESYPDADFGTPGPLVHLLEKHPGSYEAELEASLRRKPTPYPVWMVNRLLNSALPVGERRRWISLLLSAIQHPEATESAKALAEDFIEYQKQTKG